MDKSEDFLKKGKLQQLESLHCILIVYCLLFFGYCLVIECSIQIVSWLLFFGCCLVIVCSILIVCCLLFFGVLSGNFAYYTDCVLPTFSGGVC